MSDLSVVIMAGGTGGHVFPALSVAEKLRQDGAELNWLGTARGIESTLVPKADIPLHCLTIEGVRGKGVVSLLKAPFLLLSAIFQSAMLLKKIKPQVVLGLGGFASGPGGVAARLLGIPLVIHEQNAVAGTTNRLLSKIATRCLEAFPGSIHGAQHVGNPVRENIASSVNTERQKGLSEGPLKLLVLGGSLGALALNEVMPEALALLPEEQRPEVKHQTGERHLAVTEQAYKKAEVKAEVLSFIDDIAAVYDWADLVICRAGALTVSELTAAGKASMLVPYPYAIDDHQTKNAQWLVDNNAGVLQPQSSMNAAEIAQFIRDVSIDRIKLKEMGECAKALAMPAAADTVKNICVEVAHV